MYQRIEPVPQHMIIIIKLEGDQNGNVITSKSMAQSGHYLHYTEDIQEKREVVCL